MNLRTPLFALSASALVALLAASPCQAAESGSAKPPSFEAQSAATQAVAERYLRAYVAKDWDALGAELAEQGSFHDAAARLVFGELHPRGRKAVLDYFRQVYSVLTTHEFKLERAFFSGDYAVFSAVADWSFAPSGQPAVRSKTPIVITLRVQNGQVLEHVDLTDYHPYLAAYRDALAAQPR
ncbi:nuclear transport factor 2 family protein [Paucibacter sp. APW11]|uniref:Nuclear transport factor 2 family protein n=1 Tax=Roseateles aquae TaxID=3077235 RepID=A0ABU3PDS3_9BURK|nr:nuclear transport factor 2 family protein [Paucibacter sp. APW11]MDT9000750.1 nuclear transport factor 2 family protein [Paucibacter sp. APW11]